jgi:hypothetical protein
LVRSGWVRIRRGSIPAGPAGGEAIHEMDTLNTDHLNNSSAEAVATAIHGSTAALLHLADTIVRTNTTI